MSHNPIDTHGYQQKLISHFIPSRNLWLRRFTSRITYVILDYSRNLRGNQCHDQSPRHYRFRVGRRSRSPQSAVIKIQTNRSHLSRNEKNNLPSRQEECMYRLFLIPAFRNLRRHKLQSFINLVSLALGLAVFAFAFLYVKQQLSYDRGWPDAERIHRLIVESRGLPGTADAKSTAVDARVWPSVVEHFANEIDTAVRVKSIYATIKDASPPRVIDLFFVDAAFSELFPLDVISGDLDRVLSGPGFIALEETLATALGPNIGPGTRLTFVVPRGGELELEVAALYRLPANRSAALTFPAISRIHEAAFSLFGELQPFQSWESSSQIWLKLKPGVDTNAFNALQPAFLENEVHLYDPALGPKRRISEHVFYQWQALPNIYFNPIGLESVGAGDAVHVATFAVVGLLVLLVGCSNSVSLSLASAIERRKEIGIRKAAGALPSNIIVQHLGEAVLLALIALIPASLLLEALLPAFQTLLSFKVALDPGVYEYLLLVLIAVVVGLVNGIYPALVLSSVKPQAALKPAAGTGARAGQSLRELLVGGQFCFASMLLIGTGALYLQVEVIRNQPLGFEPDNLIFSYFIGFEGNPEFIEQELLNVPGVIAVTGAFTVPNANTGNSSMTLISKEANSGEVKSFHTPTDHDLLAMLQVPLLAGRYFDPARDQLNTQAPPGTPPPVRSLIINRAAASALGFASPDAAVDQLIHGRTVSQNNQLVDFPLRIIGVVEDNMYGILRRRPGPEHYYLAEPPPLAYMVQYDAAFEGSILKSINALAQQWYGAPPNSIFLEQFVERILLREQDEGKLLLTCSGLALLLAAIGLYGLAAFSMERRAKEVGVRKVMGAEVGSLLALFLWRFFRPVLLANIAAWPVAVYFVLQWMERFPYQLDKAWLLPLCLGAAFVVLLVTLSTVSVITCRAASAKPVQSLRYE
jgi:putative ABC transport system permease protein